MIHGDKLVAPELLLGEVTLFFFNRMHQFTSRIEAKSARLEDGEWVIDGGQALGDQRSVRGGAGAPPADEVHLAPHRREPGIVARHDVVKLWGAPRVHRSARTIGLLVAQRHRLQFNILLARPFLFCAMVLVAATFSLRMQRRGRDER